MIQKSRIILSRYQQAININSLQRTSILSKGYINAITLRYGLIQKQLYNFSNFKNQFQEQTNFQDADFLDREAKKQQGKEDEEKQRQFILEQIESKRKFDELFNIFVEKKKDEMKIKEIQESNNEFINIFHVKYCINYCNIDIPKQRIPSLKGVLDEILFYLQRNNSDDESKSYSIISPKQYIQCVFLAFKYMERNDIFDLDYLVKTLHNITLIIYKQTENEKKLNQSQTATISNEKESAHMIIGSLMNFSEIIKESIQLRPHIFLEKDFQEVLTDYFEILSLNSEELAKLRRNFLGQKENLLNSDKYQYFIENQMSLNQLAGVLLLYNSKDKLMVYDCLERIFKNNIDWDDFILNFLDNFRIQFYKDIANQNGEQAQNISQKSFKLATLLYSNQVSQKKLIQDKLLSNLIKLFTIKKNNMYEQELKAIVQQISTNKEIMLQRESNLFREEFNEFKQLRNSSNKKVKEILEPLFK